MSTTRPGRPPLGIVARTAIVAVQLGALVGVAVHVARARG